MRVGVTFVTDNPSTSFLPPRLLEKKEGEKNFFNHLTWKRPIEVLGWEEHPKPGIDGMLIYLILKEDVRFGDMIEKEGFLLFISEAPLTH